MVGPYIGAVVGNGYGDIAQQLNPALVGITMNLFPAPPQQELFPLQALNMGTMFSCKLLKHSFVMMFELRRPLIPGAILKVSTQRHKYRIIFQPVSMGAFKSLKCWCIFLGKGYICREKSRIYPMR